MNNDQDEKGLQRTHPPLVVRYLHETEDLCEALRTVLSEWNCFELTLRQGPDPHDPDWAALGIRTRELTHERMNRVVTDLIEKAELSDWLIPWERWRQMPRAVPARRLDL